MIADKRIVKTRTHIKNAFMQLLMKNEISKINVSDITVKAGINRSTFYLHYSGVNAVLKDIEKELSLKIATCIDNFNIENISESTWLFFNKLTEMLNSAEETKNFILYSTSSPFITAKLKNILAEKALEALKTRFPKMNTEKAAVRLGYAAAGIIDTYVNWANDKENPITLDELILVVSDMTSRLLQSIILY